MGSFGKAVEVGAEWWARGESTNTNRRGYRPGMQTSLATEQSDYHRSRDSWRSNTLNSHAIARLANEVWCRSLPSRSLTARPADAPWRVNKRQDKWNGGR